MSAIYVCPLSKLADTVEQSGAGRIVTLINAATKVDRPSAIAPDDHLFLGFHDIVEPMDGMLPPGEEHVQEFLRFVGDWRQDAPMVVHCFAGVSRSTAGAFTALCALRPDLNENLIAERIRARSPQATPNSRLVALADDILGRQGRMVDAVAAIGRGTFAYEGSVFSIAVDE